MKGNGIRGGLRKYSIDTLKIKGENFKMNRKYLRGIIFLLFFSMAKIAYASEPIKILFYGNQLNLSTPAVIDNGTTLVPLRNVFEAFNADVKWDSNNKTITAEKEGKSIWLKINSKVALINGKEAKLYLAPKIIDGNTLVPLRFVSESFDSVVGWDSLTRTITIGNTNTKSVKSIGVIIFRDEKLEKVIRDKIHKPVGEILKSDVERLTELDIWKKGVTDLEGIQHLTKLEFLDLYDNEINDISQLSYLTNLKTLGISESKVSDISALSKLLNLERLVLSYNDLSDISILSKLTNLKYLYLDDNKINNINPLSKLTNLKKLGLANNKITSISPLKNLNNLVELKLDGNPIKDYSPTQNYYKNLEMKDFTLMGRHLTSIDVQYDMQNNLDEFFYLNGIAELDDYYNYGFNNDIEDEYFCVQIMPEGKTYADAWYIYFDRDRKNNLYEQLKKGKVAVKTNCIIPSDMYEKGQGNMALGVSASW